MNANTPPNEWESPRGLEMVIVTRERELVDDFKVRRALPSAKRRMVGPFIFLDQMGPDVLRAGRGLDVAPHPHIGLATVTYLFEGELMHRDGLGTVQPICPGELNWMTAGRGIAHSERTPQEMRLSGSPLFGIQSWVAMPKKYEESDLAFAHHGTNELPVIEGEGKRVRLITGSLYGAQSPVQTLSQMFYADIMLCVGSAPPHTLRARGARRISSKGRSSLYPTTEFTAPGNSSSLSRARRSHCKPMSLSPHG